MNTLYTCILLAAINSPLRAEPLVFSKKTSIPGKTINQTLAILNDYANKCATGCKYPAMNLLESLILEQSPDRLLIWQQFGDSSRAAQFREIAVIRSPQQTSLQARLPDRDSVRRYEQKYGKKQSTTLTQFDEQWILQEQKLFTTVNFSSVLDGPDFAIPELKQSISLSYQQSLAENDRHLNQPIDFPLVQAERWQAVPKDLDIFPRNEMHKICPLGTWQVEADAVEIKTGACNYLTLTQTSRVKIPAGTQLRLVMWHSQLTAKVPAEGHLGLALKKKIYWQRPVAIPSDPQDYETIVTLEEAIQAGDPIDVHIDNHGSNAWTIYSLEWIANEGVVI